MASNKANPGVSFGGNLQNVFGKLGVALEPRDTNVVDFFSWLAKQGNEPAIEDMARLAERMPRPTLVAPPAAPKPAPIEEMVNGDQRPGILIELDLEKHRRTGKAKCEKRADGELYRDGRRVVLYFTPEQADGGIVGGHKLRKELGDGPDLNAVDLEYLYAHQELIPDSWKGKVVSFWGTIFRDGVSLYVAYLFWNGVRWCWNCHWLDLGWGSNRPAARFAS